MSANDGVAAAAGFLEALDGATWDGPEVPQALRRIAHTGGRAAEEDCYPLHRLLTREGAPSAAPVALPFVIALAADPALGARVAVVELLVALRTPELADRDWSGALALLDDPDPAVRRAALPLERGIARLLERWRVEEDPAVRLPVLLALGKAVAVASDGTGPAADDARAVLADVLGGDDPVLRVAAVHAAAESDRDLPVRQLDRLVEVFRDPALRPRFAEVWHTPGAEGPWSREDVVRSTTWLLAHRPEAELAFAVRLVEAADRTGDHALCREALDAAWLMLTRRRSAEAALLPLAGGLLAHPDAGVRLRAANLLAALGPVSAPYADGLAALLDDDGEDEFLDGTVGAIARWALTRVGDPRALPGLIARLRAQAEEQGRGYVVGEPRRPEVVDVLVPLRAHADVLLPAIREAIGEGGPRSGATRVFLEVLEAWGEAALPALPEVLSLLADDWSAPRAAGVLRAMGPPAAPTDVPPGSGPTAEQVRSVLENAVHLPRIDAAVALCSITGEAGPSLSVLAEFVLPVAEGGRGFLHFRAALRGLLRIGAIGPAIRAALLTVRRSDRRLADEGGYPMVLRDQELRALVERALACPDHPSGGAS
ncbi:hypothetical protein [Kitasatospora sp. NPDC008115]|uniref:hypothetical protein n=1 Tax=Kitasatospora sp. NPDC008115 TaxID=3364022 RepID=UPI0036E6A214